MSQLGSTMLRSHHTVASAMQLTHHRVVSSWWCKQEGCFTRSLLRTGRRMCRTESAAEGLAAGVQVAEQRWQVERCTVDAQGVTSTCGGQLQVGVFSCGIVQIM